MKELIGELVEGRNLKNNKIEAVLKINGKLFNYLTEEPLIGWVEVI